MAKILDTFEFVLRNGWKYPWNEWLDGQIWQLKKGEDFLCSIHAFQAAVHLAAKARKHHAKTRTIDENTIVIKAIAKK